MQTTKTEKRITLSTLKSFIRKNSDNLFINVKSSFDGMYDCCMAVNGGFKPVENDTTNSLNATDYYNSTQGIKGVWLVGNSRDYFLSYEDDNFTGIEVTNSCGTFILAIKE
jgi:hypothetical protein